MIMVRLVPNTVCGKSENGVHTKTDREWRQSATADTSEFLWIPRMDSIFPHQLAQHMNENRGIFSFHFSRCVVCVCAIFAMEVAVTTTSTVSSLLTSNESTGWDIATTLEVVRARVYGKSTGANVGEWGNLKGFIISPNYDYKFICDVVERKKRWETKGNKRWKKIFSTLSRVRVWQFSIYFAMKNLMEKITEQRRVELGWEKFHFTLHFLL